MGKWGTGGGGCETVDLRPTLATSGRRRAAAALKRGRDDGCHTHGTFIIQRPHRIRTGGRGDWGMGANIWEWGMGAVK